jgi:hypothetical protein
VTKRLRLTLSAIGLSLMGVGSSQAALIDRGGGLIYDDVLNVTWMQDTQYAVTSGYKPFARMGWVEANEWVGGLEYYDSVRGTVWDDWRMPTTVNSFASLGFDPTGASSELSYMYYVNLGFQANWEHDPNTPDPSSDAYNPFYNLAFRGHWSQTLSPSRDTVAWLTHFHFGSNEFSDVSDAMYVWAVRDGDVGAGPVQSVPEPSTLALLGLGLIGASLGRRRKKAA